MSRNFSEGIQAKSTPRSRRPRENRHLFDLGRQQSALQVQDLQVQDLRALLGAFVGDEFSHARSHVGGCVGNRWLARHRVWGDLIDEIIAWPGAASELELAR